MLRTTIFLSSPLSTRKQSCNKCRSGFSLRNRVTIGIDWNIVLLVLFTQLLLRWRPDQRYSASWPLRIPYKLFTLNAGSPLLIASDMSETSTSHNQPLEDFLYKKAFVGIDQYVLRSKLLRETITHKYQNRNKSLGANKSDFPISIIRFLHNVE